MKYTQEEQDQILRKINSGVIGKRKDWVWERRYKVPSWENVYTLKTVKKIAKLYKRRRVFSLSEHSPYYFWAQANGKLDEVCKHMDSRVPTKEIVKEIADQCKTRTEFSKLKFSYYQRAKNEGWLDDWFPNPIKPGKQKINK